jgi:alanine racemase
MSWFSRIFDLKRSIERPLSVLNEIHISQKNLLSNYDFLASLQTGVDIFPVLKSNAYGHGIEQVATILKKRKPVYIVVDSYYEALRVHDIHSSRILLIGYNLPENYVKMNFLWITPVITDLETLVVL